MKVSEIMTTDVKTCDPETPLRTVAYLESTLDLGTIPVVDAEARLVGLITQRDLCRVLVKPVPEVARLTAHDIMESDYASCAPSDDVRTVLRLMRDRQLRQIPVVSLQGLLCGMLSLSDLILNARHEATGTTPSDAEVMRAIQAISARRCSSMRLRAKGAAK
jgi:CBS domain-containing protein